MGRYQSFFAGNPLALPLGCLVLLVASACKPSTRASESKSLDNFGSRGGAFTFNSCAGSNPVQVPDAQIDGNAAERAAVRAALSAVPAELQAAFFKDLGGKVVMTPSLSANCRVPAADDRESMLSCWAPSGNSVQILIKRESDEASTIRNIRHATVRSMGFILTDVILRVRPAAGGGEISGEQGTVDEMAREIAAALLADIKASKKYEVPVSLNTGSAEFRQAAFAESFDSFYCSPQSSAIMQRDFPKTYVLFTDVAAVMPEALTAKPDSFARETGSGFDSSGKSIGLWGRWGWGSGPIRQGFSNWGQFRASGGGLFNFNRYAEGGGLVFRRPWFDPSRWGN